ncbi:MAG: hypothetical protein ACR2FL_06645 [Nocardioidaceae bacterium]|nr:hypothetical protein [Nocardioidaceae bacterium]
MTTPMPETPTDPDQVEPDVVPSSEPEPFANPEPERQPDLAPDAPGPL